MRLKLCRPIFSLMLLSFLAGIVHVDAQAPTQTSYPLDSWSFYDTNGWTSDYSYAPVSFTNLGVSLYGDSIYGSGSALILDSTNAAWLQYNVYEHDGTTNLTVNQGSLTLWFSPDWGSTNVGGTGPGWWGQLIDAGQWTTNASYGWWSLYTDPEGANLYFSAQNNSGTETNYLSAPITWTSNQWHFLALTYSTTNTALYLDGQLATNGAGMSIWPDSEVLANGFYIGSDTNGETQAHGIFDEIYTYNFVLDSNTVSSTFNSFLPGYHLLDSWSFLDNTNWTSDLGYAPVSFTNLNYSYLGDGRSLVVNTNVPAWLQYNVVETNGRPNLTVNQGSVTFWFGPDWASTNSGGSGPGECARLLEVGGYTPDSSYGWWSIYVDEGGNNLYFSTQTNDLSSNVWTWVSAPISWTTNYFHFIALTYSATNTALYLDGVLATNGPPLAVYPGPDVLTNGFYIGSDSNGVLQAHGMFDQVATYNYPLDSNDVQTIFNWYYPNFMIDPYNAAYMDLTSSENISSFGTNLALSPISISNNFASLFVVNSAADILYEIQGTTNLARTNWISEGFVDGSELTNLTTATVSLLAANSRTLLLRIRSWIDSTGTGIPDWWWLTYFGQITNVNAYASAAGDGYSNLQKFQMGLNPTNYYNPNPPAGFFGCLDASGTNAFIEWSNAPGPVINYVIQRGIQNTNTGNYAYSQVGLVSSNATFFEDVGAITNANAQNNIYNLWAVYPGGSLSATNTWEVWWYTQEGNYGPPNGPPMPGNIYAYADATGTNVLISWTPAQGDATNYIIEQGIYDPTNYSYNYYPIAHVSTNTTNYEVVGAITNEDDWSDIYGVVAVYPGGGLSLLTQGGYFGIPSTSYINVGSSTNGAAAPPEFYGYADSTGTNIYLTWSPASGAVTNYIILGGTYDDDTGGYNYIQLGKVNASTTSFEVVGGTYVVYVVEAVYTNGSLSQAASWYSASGAPAPGALSAYLDSTGTNIVLVWTPAQGAVTNYIIKKSYNSGDSYSQIGDVSSNTTSFTDVGGNDDEYGLDAIMYEVQATYPHGGLSAAVTASVTTNSPAPSGLSATVDSTGTNVLLTWSPAVGTVADYIILLGTYNPDTGNYSYSQIGEVSSSTTSFEDVGAITGDSSDDDIYEVEAAYAGGDLSPPDSSMLAQSSSSPTYNLSVTAQMVRNQTGGWQLMFSGISTNVQTIAFYWYIYDYFYDLGPYADTYDPLPYFSTETDIPVSNLTNGIYVIPDFLTTNWIPNNAGGKVAMVQPIGTNDERGNLFQVGFLPYDAPCWVDGRQHLKQNLLHELRAATVSQPNAPLSENNVWDDPDWTSIGIPADSNYVESSIFHWSVMYKGYDTGYAEYVKMDDLWPITANYELYENIYDTNYPSPAPFVWQTNLVTIPASPILGISGPYWISQNLADLADVAAYTNSGNLYLQSGINNLFGLTFETALVNEKISYSGIQGYPPTFGTPITVAPGSYTGLTNVNCFFSQTVVPGLQLVSYYFAPVNTPGTALPGETTPTQPYPLPALTGFSNTNQTGIMITSVGTPTVIGGWAKFSITNGSSSKFAYLGQYYVTNAYVVSTNGTVTTNTTGVVSPYGDFFPTQAGQVAMVTMPDINTGQQGTGVVDVISLDADANHDGVLDLSYTGPDQTSPSRPMRFWVDDSTDSGDTGGDGVPGQGAQGNGMVQMNHQWVINGRRDLVNLFPVYVNIGSLFQSNALSSGISVTDTNWQFVLSQADGVLRFADTGLTPTNYMNFLRDTNESGNLAWYAGNPNYAVLTTISNSGVALSPSFIAGIATNNQGIILVQAAAPTTQPLVLTIYHGTNQIAQTQLYLSISSVEQMFRYENLLLNPDTNAEPDRLTDASVPNEPDTIDKNVVFVHGYSVNPYKARGWFADIYKRLYWSGSQAKFYGVVWEGYDTQGSIEFPGLTEVTPNYQTNVFHAFQTAPLLADFIATLTNGPTVVLGHSLGNMVTLSALNDYTAPINQYFMLDAAAPMEAIDGSTAINANMVYPTWLPYTNQLYASYWYQLFATNDARSTLAWNSRFPNFNGAQVYNFYSSGEDVLRTYTNGAPPSNLFSLLGSALVSYIQGQSGIYVWAWQEKDKGLMSGNSILSSDHGGWKFNPAYDSYVDGLETNIPPSQPSELITNAFFDMSYDTAMFTTNSSGSTYAQTNRNRILSDAIPAVTLPIGANPVPSFDNDQNVNMQTLENGWPLGRLQQPEGANWHHSDIRVVAYTFTYEVFNEIVNDGNLK
jgi:hypothetical protein